MNETLDSIIKSSKGKGKQDNGGYRAHKKKGTRVNRKINKHRKGSDDYEDRDYRKQKRYKGNRQDKEHSILVFNLNFSTKIEELKTLFTPFGKIDKINAYWIPQLKDSFNAKVFYENREDCEKALEFFQGAELDGKTLRAKLN